MPAAAAPVNTKNPRSDDHADAKRHKIERAKHTFQAVLAALCDFIKRHFNVFFASKTGMSFLCVSWRYG